MGWAETCQGPVPRPEGGPGLPRSPGSSLQTLVKRRQGGWGGGHVARGQGGEGFSSGWAPSSLHPWLPPEASLGSGEPATGAGPRASRHFPRVRSGALRGPGITSTTLQRKRLRCRGAQGAELRPILASRTPESDPGAASPEQLTQKAGWSWAGAQGPRSWDRSATAEPTFLPRARHLHKPQV